MTNPQTTRNFTRSDELLADALAALKQHFDANSEITVGKDGRERHTVNAMKADHVMKDVMHKIEDHLS